METRSTLIFSFWINATGKVKPVLKNLDPNLQGATQRYTYRVLQTIQMKLILLLVWAERAVLGRAKTALKLKYEI